MSDALAAAGARAAPARPGAGTVVVGATVALALAFLPLALLAGLGGGARVGTAQAGAGGLAGAGAGAGEPGVSALAARDIPPRYLALYRAAGAHYGLDWSILAGIGKVECDHGRDPDPSCSREGAVNAAGAGGPMQFLASTWAQYGVDGDGDGRIDRWDPADAIYSAARYLRADGAPGDYRVAIFAYNHAAWYVAEVERWASRYRGVAGTGAGTGEEEAQGGLADGAQGASAGGAQGGLAGAAARLAGETATPVRFLAGEQARLEPGDGHLALIPAGVPATVQALVVAGNELQELPYGPDGHPDPRGAPDEDCSSTLNYVLYRAGVRPLSEILARNPLAQDYVHWGAPGPGRWVTIYATDTPTPHVFVVIAGLRLDTSHDGTDLGPNRGEDGPRWRILDHIPTWAHWSVRHPPGL